eukprot:jgi/Mesvir1/14809/Mv05445-RA.4
MGLTFTCGAFRRPGDGGARHGWVKVEPNEDSRLLPVCGGLLFQLAISDATGQLVGWGDGVPDGRARADGGKVGGGILGGAPDSSSACIASHVPQSVLPPGLGRVVCAASGWDRACAVTEDGRIWCWDSSSGPQLQAAAETAGEGRAQAEPAAGAAVMADEGSAAPVDEEMPSAASQCEPASSDGRWMEQQEAMAVPAQHSCILLHHPPAAHHDHTAHPSSKHSALQWHALPWHMSEESQAAGGVSLAAAATASPSSQREALRDKKGATITQKPSGSGEPPAKAPRTLGGSLVRFTSLALGEEHALALDENGQVWAWGSGAQGQLGMGRDTLAVTEPQRVPGKRMGHGGNAGTQAAILSGIRTGVHNADIPGPASPPEFCAGEGGSCVGNPTVAQGGRGVHRLRRAVKVACGGRHSLILSERGELFSFGWGLYGQTGHGCTDDSFEPRLVGALAGCPVADVAASVWHTVAATVDGAVYAWGWNKFGQLGLPESSSELTPALVESPLLDDVCIVAVSCGARHTAVVSGWG